MKLAVATLSCALALAPAPQRPPQTRRALLAKSGIAGLSLAGPLVALPEAANAGRLQDMAAAREAKKEMEERLTARLCNEYGMDRNLASAIVQRAAERPKGAAVASQRPG